MWIRPVVLVGLLSLSGCAAFELQRARPVGAGNWQGSVAVHAAGGLYETQQRTTAIDRVLPWINGGVRFGVLESLDVTGAAD